MYFPIIFNYIICLLDCYSSIKINAMLNKKNDSFSSCFLVTLYFIWCKHHYWEGRISSTEHYNIVAKHNQTNQVKRNSMFAQAVNAFQDENNNNCYNNRLCIKRSVYKLHYFYIKFSSHLTAEDGELRLEHKRRFNCWESVKWKPFIRN